MYGGFALLDHSLLGLTNTSRMHTDISPGQWQLWAVSPLLGLISNNIFFSRGFAAQSCSRQNRHAMQAM